ncbi:MAG: UDP-N-acetylmuramate--L-alanine ligase [Acidimicrobiales bacterium]|nr:UDP-N-acetylmuramate--L-alanine ligase [Acidimicrobiales bacterium]
MNRNTESGLLDTGSLLKIHIVGIGGAGMRAIALVLASMGHEITGSDLKNSAGLDRLTAEGISVTIGHSANNLGEVDLVTRSTAISDANIEIRMAMKKNIQIVSRAEILTAITSIKSTIAVAGTHGKTTTSSMLAVALTHAGLNPSFVIGGEVNEIGCGALWKDTSKILIVEADESDGTFLKLDSDYAIITNIEPDHLEHYGGEAGLRSAFSQFLGNVQKKSFICADDVGAREFLGSEKVTTYGVDPEADYVIENYEGSRFSSKFSIKGPYGELGEFTVATPGVYNARNATAAIVFGDHLGADIDLLRKGLAQFAGVARRFHFRGERNGVSFVDDYAHLPTEVESVLEAIEEGQWGRVVCVFQPHRYTRTSELWQDFSHSFENTDVLFITGIYAAGEAPIPGISGRLIADAVKDSFPEKQVIYCEHRDDLLEEIKSKLVSGDVCVTLGAGDITTLPNELTLGG